MSTGLDYNKAKRRARMGDPLFGHWNTSGWRVEYPEQFPVTTTRKDRVDNTRPQDYNGHVPDSDLEQAGGCCDECNRELIVGLHAAVTRQQEMQAEFREQVFRLGEAMGYTRTEILDQAIAAVESAA